MIWLIYLGIFVIFTFDALDSEDMHRRKFIVTVTSLTVIPIAGCSSSDDGPKGAAKSFVKAEANGNYEKYEELIHPQSSFPFQDEEELQGGIDVTIQNVETVKLQDWYHSENLSEEELDDETRQIEDRMDEIGADDYSFVRINAKADSTGDRTGYLFVVKEDGDWYIFSFNTVG
jgi:hypothetical protein